MWACVRNRSFVFRGLHRQRRLACAATAAFSSVVVEAAYQFRSNDILKCHKQATVDWPVRTFTSHLDRDWVLFCIPAKWFVESCGGVPADTPHAQSVVWACASRRGATVVINARPPGMPAAVTASEHPIFALPSLLAGAGSVSLPHGSSIAREMLNIVVDPSSEQWCSRFTPADAAPEQPSMPVCDIQTPPSSSPSLAMAIDNSTPSLSSIDGRFL